MLAFSAYKYIIWNAFLLHNCNNNCQGLSSSRGHSGTLPAAGGQRLCFLEHKLTFRWRLPLWAGYVVVLSPYQLFFFFLIASFSVKLLTCIHLLFTVTFYSFFTGCHSSSVFDFVSRCRGWYQHSSHPRPGSRWPGGAAHHQVGPERRRARSSRLLWAWHKEVSSWKLARWGTSCWTEGQQLDPRLSTAITWPLIGHNYLHQQLPLGSYSR